MKQVKLDLKTGEVKVVDVPIPSIESGEVLVHNKFSLISGGTELHLIELGKKSLIAKAKARPDLAHLFFNRVKRDGFLTAYKQAMSRLDKPEALGYSSSGEIIAVGTNVKDLKIGDRVACGGAGFASHAEIVAIPRNLCVRLPNNVDCRDASFTTVGSIAMQGIRNADVKIGENVVVIGLGLIGQLAVQLLKIAGCQVFGVDLDEKKINLALALGADKALLSNLDNLEYKIMEFFEGNGADAVIITAATHSNDPVNLAGNIARDKAKIVIVGNVGMDIPREMYYKKELNVIVSRSYGPGRYDRNYEDKSIDYPIGYVRWTENRNMQAFIKILEEKKLRLDELISHKFMIDDAERAYELIMEKKPYLGILLEYPDHFDHIDRLIINKEANFKQLNNEIITLGVIGAGNFAASTLLPSLKKINNIKLKGLAATTGLSVHSIAKKFGFEYCTTDYKKILSDNEIDAVLIATNNVNHASLTVESLQAGKHVFVEKPLAVTEEQLNKVVEAHNKNPGIVMVGFNRRFAPLGLKLKKFFEDRIGPMVALYRVNAETIPSDHWIYDIEQGGGRIITECCHFIDFLQYIVNSRIIDIHTKMISNNNFKPKNVENCIITISFEDGSIGTIIYTNKGDDAYSKEMCEFFSDGSVASLIDFRKLEFISNGQRKKFIKRFSLDKGHYGELKKFIEMITNGSENNEDFESYISSSLATLKTQKNIK